MNARSAALSAEQILSAVSAIGLQIHQSVPLEVILHRAVETVKALLPTDRVVLDRGLPQDQGDVQIQVVDPATTALDRGFLQGALVVPVLNQGQVWGVFSVQPLGSRQWHALEVHLVQQLAQQLGIAVQQAALRQQLDRVNQLDWVNQPASPAPPSPLLAQPGFDPVFAIDGQSPNQCACNDEERQQTEAALRRSEAKNRAIIAAIPDLMFRVGIDGVYRGYVTNPRPLDLLSAESDPIGRPMTDLLPAELAARQLHYLQLTLATGELQIYEQQLQVGDRLQDEEVRVVPSGEDEVLFMIRDISEAKRSQAQRQQAEAALQASEQRYRAVVEAQTELVVRWSPDRTLLFTNAAACRFLGQTREQLLGQDFFSVLPDSIRAGLQLEFEDMIRALSPDCPYAVNEYWIVDATGQWRFYHWSDRGIFGSAGELIEIQSVGHDITDRKRIEDALRQSEAHQSALIRALPDLVMRTNRAGTYLDFIATQTFKVIGDTGDLVGTHVFDSLPPNLAQRRMDAIDRALETRAIQVYEQDLTIGENWQTEEVRVVPYAENEVLLVVRDISDRKQAEQAIHQRIQQQQALNQVVQAIRQSLDLETIFVTATVQIAQLLAVDRSAIVQYMPEENRWKHLAEHRCSPEIPSALGMYIPDRGNPLSAQLKRLKTVQIDDANCITEPMLQEFARRFPGAWLLVPLVVGRSVWGAFSVVKLKQPSPWTEEQIRLAQATADQLAIAIQQSHLYQQVQHLNTNLELQVQERTRQLQQSLAFEALLKRITDKVRDSLDEQQILQTVVQELAQGLNVECCDTGIYNADQTTSTIAYEFTQSLAPAQGKTFEIVNATHSEVYPALFRGHSCHFSNRFQLPLRPGSDRLTILTCPILDDQGILGDLWLFKPMGAVFDDQEVRLVKQVANQCAIALRQSRLYQAAQHQVQELERLNHLKDDFLNTVSHELRTPLSSIKLAIQMLEIHLEPMGVLVNNSNPINRYFTILQEESQREIELINNLLDLARLDADTDLLQVTPLLLQYFIPHLAEPFIERACHQQQQLTLEIADTLPPFETNPSYLERILTELLHNACKYTPAGGTIALSARLIPPGLEIWITNSGIEIPAAECDRIFDKFYRIPNNDPWKHGGTGLGLALVKKLTEQLGATIRVESQRGQTSFVLAFLGPLFIPALDSPVD